MSEQVASHSEEVQEEQKGLSDDQYSELMKQFGYETKEPAESVKEESEQESDEEDEDEKEPPATEEQPKTVRKVKFNKKEVEIPEEQIDEFLQKGLALDKERERKSEYEKALQRAAKLAGFESHEEYLKSLDKLEEQAKQREKEQFLELKKELREDAESYGLDPDKVEKFIENHPLMKQAREAIAEREKIEQKQRIESEKATVIQQWEELFSKYPDLSESEDAEWLTPEMDNRIKRGYSPLDAYEIAHKDKILEAERQKLRQSVIKEQKLNKRAKVEGQVAPEPEDGVPDSVKGAFALFGLDPRTARKFIAKR